jgi:hypothetical protein
MPDYVFLMHDDATDLSGGDAWGLISQGSGQLAISRAEARSVRVCAGERRVRNLPLPATCRGSSALSLIVWTTREHWLSATQCLSLAER